MVTETNTVTKYEDLAIEDLIVGFKRNILYDAHSLEARFSRSFYVQEMKKRGKLILKDIAKELESFLLTQKQKYQKYESDDLHIAWIYMLCNIVNDENLPNKPYGPEVPCLSQDLKVWINYCNDI